MPQYSVNYTPADGTYELLVQLSDGETISVHDVADMWASMNLGRPIGERISGFIFVRGENQTLGIQYNGWATALGGCIVTVGPLQEYTGHKFTTIEDMNGFFIIPNYDEAVGGGGGNQDPE